MNITTPAPRLSVAIVSPHARYYGGVEFVNHLLLKMLETEGFSPQILSQELLKKGLLFNIMRRIYGLNGLLARHFNQHYAAGTDVVICNGEFSHGVRHPAAINSFHGCYYGYAKALRSYIPNRGYRNLMHMADQQKQGAEGKYVIAVSKSLSEILKEQGISVDIVIDNAINTELFRPSKDVSRNDRCIFVGSSDYYGKGFDILEKLADRGIGVDCVTAVKPKDDRLGWLGNIPNEELPAYYRRYKACILPSRFEGCSLVALEAMACGTPILTTPVGAGPDIALEIPEFVVEAPWNTVADRMMEQMRKIETGYDDLSNRARDYVLRHHAYEDWKQKWLQTIAIVIHRARSGK